MVKKRNEAKWMHEKGAKVKAYVRKENGEFWGYIEFNGKRACTSESYSTQKEALLAARQFRRDLIEETKRLVADLESKVSE